MEWLKNICRICGEVNNIYHYIYNKELPTSLEEKIKKCFHLEFFKEDYKPKQVCYSCVNKINEFSDFIDICYATNQKLESLYCNSQEGHHRNTYNDNYNSLNENKHQSVIVSTKQGTENVEISYNKSGNTVLEMFVTNLNDSEVLTFTPPNDYVQGSCDTFFSEPSGNKLLLEPEFQTTVLRHPQNESELFDIATYRAPQKLNLPCEYPESVSRNAYEDNNLPTPRKLNSFSDNIHNNENIPVSKTSNLISVQDVQKLVSTEPLTAVVKTAINEKKYYQCPHCELRFLRRGTLNAHISVHTNIKPYSCNTCSKSFPVKFKLTAHEKTHSGHHKCTVCSKRFPVPSKLERHIRIHTNDKPFRCDYPNCLKAFSDKRNLEGHKCVHMTDREFLCDLCQKTFKTKSKLHRHEQCHHNSARYTCELCSKQYRHRTNLISHLKKH